jgi:hypothetical protein
MALWGKLDNANSKPKYLNDADKAETFGVNVSEAQQAENRAKGLKVPGFTKLHTYTDAQGHVRYKSEVLVAMGAGATVAVMGDAADDATVVDGTITITTQPANRSVTAPASTTFTVAASVSPANTLTYQWQADNGTGYGFRDFTVDNEPAFTGWNTATLTVNPSSTDYTGWKLRCVVSAAGDTSKTSAEATLTVA